MLENWLNMLNNACMVLIRLHSTKANFMMKVPNSKVPLVIIWVCRFSVIFKKADLDQISRVNLKYNFVGIWKYFCGLFRKRRWVIIKSALLSRVHLPWWIFFYQRVFEKSCFLNFWRYLPLWILTYTFLSKFIWKVRFSHFLELIFSFRLFFAIIIPDRSSYLFFLWISLL